MNVTLDNNTITFPLNQSLYFDFSHDTNTWSYLTALGLTQFAPLLPTSHIERNRSQIRSYLTPFGGRVDIEVIKAKGAVPSCRTCASDSVPGPDVDDTPVQYIHLLVGQRTVPLHASYPEVSSACALQSHNTLPPKILLLIFIPFGQCSYRDDGWCELHAFLNATSDTLAESRYEFACFGDYDEPYGQITNGALNTLEKQNR